MFIKTGTPVRLPNSLIKFRYSGLIVAEYFHFQGKTLSVSGRGRAVSRATDSGNLPVLLAATIVMSLIVVTMSPTLWRRLHRLARREVLLACTMR